MKNIIFLVAMLSILANCKKNQLPIDIPDDPVDTTQTPIDTHIIELGKSFVLKNGFLWGVPLSARYQKNAINKFQLEAEIINSNLVGETFSIYRIPCSQGIYPLEYFAVANFSNQIPEAIFVMMYEFDQPIGDFMVDTTRNDHFVEVIRYDSAAKTVEGRFQVFLGKKPTNVPFPGVPDSIFMTEGKFHLKIEDP